MFNKRQKEIERIVLGESTFGVIPCESKGILSIIDQNDRYRRHEAHELRKEINRLKAILNEVVDHVYKENNE